MAWVHLTIHENHSYWNSVAEHFLVLYEKLAQIEAGNQSGYLFGASRSIAFNFQSLYRQSYQLAALSDMEVCEVRCMGLYQAEEF